jgi:hypothetical protein
MFRDLYYKNLQRLAYTFSPDSTYFSIDYLQENLNKEDYLREFNESSFAELKGTKTATEILIYFRKYLRNTIQCNCTIFS